MESAMASGAAQGMRTMDGALLKLYQQGRITRETALEYAANYDAMAKRI